MQVRQLAAQTLDLRLSLVGLGSRGRRRFPKRIDALGPEHMGTQELHDFLPCPVLPQVAVRGCSSGTNDACRRFSSHM